MRRRSDRTEAIGRGSEIPTTAPIARPAVTGAVELAHSDAPGSPEPTTAVEMPRAWKSQNDFHTRLEISHRTRDSHIPTAASLYRSEEQDEKHDPLCAAVVCSWGQLRAARTSGKWAVRIYGTRSV
jgi:hypothetical protein